MKLIYKRVVGLIGVSSENKAKIFSVSFVLFLAAVSGAFGQMKNSAAASDITVDSVVNLTNQSRWDFGKKALGLNMKLSEAARLKAEDMLTNNYFSHNSPTGKTPWFWIDEENYDYNYAGENLAMDFHSTEKMEGAWIASPTHRANILNEKYTDIGVAVKEGILSGHSTTLVVVLFGSGDKNISSLSDERKEAFEVKDDLKSDSYFPNLPIAQKREKNIFPQEPVITSPQMGALTAENKMEICGRANPGDQVSVFDNQTLIAEVASDAEGWFSVEEQNLSAGKHQLAVANKKTISQTPVDFFVDQRKPEIDFHLFADKENPGRFFLAVKSNKDNCTVEFNGESRAIGLNNQIIFSLDGKKSSAVLHIFDRAGNKNFKQVTLVNYYFQNKNQKNSLPKKLALKNIIPEKIFSLDSGRQAIEKNLGLVSHNFLASAVKIDGGKLRLDK